MFSAMVMGNRKGSCNTIATRARPAFQDVARAEPQHRARPERDAQAGGEAGEAAEQRAPPLGADGVAGVRLEPLPLARLLGERLHDGDAEQGLLHMRLDEGLDL